MILSDDCDPWNDCVFMLIPIKTFAVICFARICLLKSAACVCKQLAHVFTKKNMRTVDKQIGLNNISD